MPSLDKNSVTAIWRRADRLSKGQWKFVQDNVASFLDFNRAHLLRALDEFQRDHAGKSLADWWNESIRLFPDWIHPAQPRSRPPLLNS